MIEILQKWGKAIAFYLVPINVFLLPPMIGVRCELVVLQVRMIFFFFADMQYDEDDDEITPDLWQEACWIVIR